MRTLKTVFILMAVILMGSLVLTCEKDNDKTVATDNEVSFAINVSNLKSTSQLKSTMDYNLADADKIILTILNSDGSPTKYTSSEVKIQQMNGDYYTQKIVLKTGDYNLTEFIILNAADSTIFATPLTGSQEAQNVSNSLPNAFSVAKDVTTPVNVEVLSTEKKTPEDFGLSRFPIIEVKTFGFMIGVADNESDKLLSSVLTVSNGSYSYVQNLDSITNNVVTVKDGLSNYTLTVEKSGYETYTHTYPIDSLKMFKDTIGNLPLLVELEKGVTDIDGNVYHTVTIGTQVWMVENLKTTRYNDGTAIPLVTDNTAWSNLTAGAYCFYNNDEVTYKATYGALYNWYAINTGELAPVGWHVPTDAEWSTLTDFLTNNGYGYQGSGIDIAKSMASKTGWSTYPIAGTVGNDQASNNSSGFTALPAGTRNYIGIFEYFGWCADYWSTTESDPTHVWFRGIYSSEDNVSRATNYYKMNGFPVRCLKD